MAEWRGIVRASSLDIMKSTIFVLFISTASSVLLNEYKNIEEYKDCAFHNVIEDWARPSKRLLKMPTTWVEQTDGLT